jgi:hypothetical protein
MSFRIDLLPHKDQIIDLYLKQKLPARAVAKVLTKLGTAVGYSTVLAFITNLGIKRNSDRKKKDLSPYHNDIIKMYETDCLSPTIIAENITSLGFRVSRGCVQGYLRVHNE